MSVQVWARTDQIAAVLKHPSGMPFDLNNSNTAVWPDDNYTNRRIADGDVFTAPIRGNVPAGQLSLQQLPKLITVTANMPTVAKTGP